MDSLPDQHIDSLPKQKRKEAYMQVGMVCAFRSEGRDEGQVAKRAKFESVDEMYFRLKRWGLTGLLPPERQEELPKPTAFGAEPKQRPRGSGPSEEVPDASGAVDLFDEMLDELRGTVRLVEDLSLGYQGKRFAGMYTFEGDWTFPRSSYSVQRWQELCRQYGQNPNVKSFSISGVTSNHPTEAGPYPPRELVMLIAAYALAGRRMEPLLKVLYPEHSEADIEEINKLLYETKFAGRRQNGLLRTAQQFAAAVYGRKVGKGAPREQPARESAREHLLACHITKRREAGLTDEEIRQEILDSGRELSNEDFARLAKLERRFPTT
jgi:hypothetical protein